MSVGRRVGELERRARGRSPRSSGEARAYMKDFLDRCAAARRAGHVPEELEAEMRAVREAMERRAGEIRGEGVR